MLGPRSLLEIRRVRRSEQFPAANRPQNNVADCGNFNGAQSAFPSVPATPFRGPAPDHLCRDRGARYCFGVRENDQRVVMRRKIPRLVPLAGIEPALLAELDFESSASTNSATGALTGRVGTGGI